MHTVVGLGMFLFSVPLALLGLADPNRARSNMILATAGLALPTGLLVAGL